jgi:hypothetical protein
MMNIDDQAVVASSYFTLIDLRQQFCMAHISMGRFDRVWVFSDLSCFSVAIVYLSLHAKRKQWPFKALI